MKTLRIPCFSLCLAALPLVAAGQSSNLPEDVTVPEEPVVTPEYLPAPMEPQVVIRGAEEQVIYEYRVNGEIVEIKVVPEVGPPYYLVPADGGGWSRTSQSRIRVPSWVIFRW
ncbi:MAG: DUF2782 domain-containing protein [Marinobacter sp.]|uniref:DUF2782 domain-containing protein n=1 Tax=Marinobacter sp. TaxID=50741 RepID=UPI00299CD53C|nr:DUF2782 domain-containing protein [Marinobacter sp.]MDX1755127.1 DUF2782 domain-containing protein [Marinobacter sp.]